MSAAPVEENINNESQLTPTASGSNSVLSTPSNKADRDELKEEGEEDQENGLL